MRWLSFFEHTSSARNEHGGIRQPRCKGASVRARPITNLGLCARPHAAGNNRNRKTGLPRPSFLQAAAPGIRCEEVDAPAVCNRFGMHEAVAVQLVVEFRS